MNAPDTTWAAIAGAVALVALPAIALAWLLRRSRSPGGPTSAAIIAGVFVGLIAGPGVFGRARPDLYNPVFRGGTSQAAALSSLRSRQDSDLTALRAINVSSAAVEELAARHAHEREPLETALAHARAARRATLDLTLGGAIGLYLLLIGGTIVPAREAPARRLATRLITQRGAPIGVGFAAAFFGVLPPALVGLAFLPARESLAFALALAVPAVTLALGPSLTLVCAVAAAACAGPALALTWTPAFTVAAIGMLGGLMWPVGLGWRWTRALRRAGVALGPALALPAVSALLAARLDPIALASDPAQAPALWFSVIAGVLWSSDGRLLAMWLALRMTGRSQERPRPWTLATRSVNAGAGVAQIALAGAMSAAFATPEPIIAGALAGGLLVEMSRAPRLWLARALEQESARAED